MTKAQIREILRTNNRAVEVALLRLFERQTDDEQVHSSTHWQNGRGFNAADAKRGSYYARWVRSGRKLTGSHLEYARALASKYAGQLVEIAEQKAQRKVRRVLQPTVPSMKEVQELLKAASARLDRLQKVG